MLKMLLVKQKVVKKRKMTEAEKHINRILEQKIKKFTENDTERNLLQAYNLDVQFRDDYHGRELFELLQNVDDAYEEYCQKQPDARGQEVKTLIEYKNNVLRVCNTGTTFRKDTVERLCQGAVSDKKEKYIGNKGIGFRSVLNWADKIRIYSGDYSIEFSKEYAQQQFDNIKDNNLVKSQIKDAPGLQFPIFAAPKWIDSKKSEYDTVVEIELLEKATDENDRWNIVHQINEFDSNILLFLPNVTEIAISLQDTLYSYKKKNNDKENIVSIISTKDNVEQQFFTFVSKGVDIAISKAEKSVVKMAFAIPVVSKELDLPLYTYFPISNTKCPFNAVMHASFRLSENRDSIRREKVNEEVFKELLKFYVNTISSFFSKQKFKNRALELLCPKKFLSSQSFYFESPFNSKDISDYYFNLCKEKAVYLNINSCFINKNDNPKIIDIDFPKAFKGSLFNDLLAPFEGVNYSFVKSLLEDTDYDEEDLCGRIDRLSAKLSVRQRVDVFVWWIKNQNNYTLLPKLLKDNSDEQKWLEPDDVCFFSGAIKKIPNWATFRFLDEECEKQLIEFCKKHEDIDNLKRQEADTDKRLTIRFLQQFDFVNFKEYTVETIIRPLNDGIGDDFDKAVEFVKFLYRNFASIKNAEKVKDICFKFPNAGGGITNSRELYFGQEYGNFFSEKILELAGYKKICSPLLLGLGNEKDIDLKEFLSWFGVVEYPRIEKDIEVYKDYKSLDGTSYEQFVINNENYYEIKGIQVKTIRNLGKILESLLQKEIVEWIFEDSELLDKLHIDRDAAKMYCRKNRWDSTIKTDMLESVVIPCYMKYIFSTTEWLEINGNKYAPSDCLLSDNAILPKYTPCVSKSWIEKNRGKFSAKELKDLLLVLGLKTKITDFSSESFYSLLLKLQEDNNTYEISQSIYKNIVADDYKEFEYSDSRQKFLNNGKVWTKNKLGYQPVSQVFFTSSAVVNVSHKYLIDLPLRTGSKEKVKKIFNIESYEEEYEIVYSSVSKSEYNVEFQKDFSDFLPYVLCYRIEKASETEKNNFKNLKISIVNNIALKDADTIEKVKDSYTLIQDLNNKNQWYIYINDTVDGYDLNKISEFLKQIFEILINTENPELLARISELFVSDVKRRDFLINQEFSNLNVLNESRLFLGDVPEEKEILVKVLKMKHEYSAKIQKQLNCVDFSDFASVKNQKELFNLLQLVDMDVKDLQKILERSDISVKDYNLERCNNLFSKNELVYKENLFEKLRTADINEKELFEQKIEEYKHYPYNNSDQISDSVLFNPKKILSEFLKINFGKELDEIKSIGDIEQNFSANLKHLKEQYNDDGQNIISTFIQSSEVKSLLYFDYNDVKRKYLEWKKSFKDSETEVLEISSSGHTHSVDDVVPCHPLSERKVPAYSHGARTLRQSYIDAEKKHQEQGDEAERQVYHVLKEADKDLAKKLDINLFDYTVNWVSEAAGRIENKNGQDGLGYDIELIHKESGEKLYIEVKSSQGNECVFEISKNEYEFAKKNPDNYIVIFVGKANSSKTSLQVLPTRFWENKSEYTLIPEKYKVFAVMKN